MSTRYNITLSAEELDQLTDVFVGNILAYQKAIEQHPDKLGKKEVQQFQGRIGYLANLGASIMMSSKMTDIKALMKSNFEADEMPTQYTINISKEELDALSDILAGNILAYATAIEQNPDWSEEKQEQLKERIECILQLGSTITGNAIPVTTKEEAKSKSHNYH